MTSLLLDHGVGVPASERDRDQDDPTFIPCCMGSAMRGPAACTCWEPVYDREQQPLADGGKPPASIATRSKCCHDCAYRNGSPERADAYEEEDLLSLAGDPAREFWCHQGSRRVVAFRHPDGRELPAGDGDYRPPVGPQDRPIVWKADGTPGERCAGWAAHRRAQLYPLYWRVRLIRPDWHGRRCRIVIHGGRRGARLIEFEDGQRVICPGSYLRRAAREAVAA